jgi:thiol-disulfide isomerase/thioredoxin
MLKIFLFCFYVLVCQACAEQNTSNSNASSSNNTSITIFFKNETDKKFAVFQQYEQYRLENYGIIPPPEHTTKETKLSKVINLSLDKPSLLLLGFNEFYIEPNDQIEIEYTIIKNTKQEFKDSFKILKGIAAMVNNGNDPFLLNMKYIDYIKSNLNYSQIVELLNEKRIRQESINAYSNFLLQNPQLKNSQIAKENLEDLSEQKYFVEILSKYDIIRPEMEKNTKLFYDSCIKSLSEVISNRQGNKFWPYWFGLKKTYEQIILGDNKKDSFSVDAMKNTISKYEKITQQYLLLLGVKNNYSENSYQKINLNEINSLLTISPFIKNLEKYKLPKTESTFLSDEVGSFSLLDFDLKQISLNEVFKNSSQKYVYLDFCGTWCKPCIEEIKRYNTTRKFENSTFVKPIWIFFENDSLSWKKIITTYNLKKEDCYLILSGKGFEEKFGQQYSWEGEFPHHFLFSNKGEIVDRNAASLESFDLDKYKTKVSSPPLLPPPPKVNK